MTTFDADANKRWLYKVQPSLAGFVIVAIICHQLSIPSPYLATHFQIKSLHIFARDSPLSDKIH